MLTHPRRATIKERSPCTCFREGLIRRKCQRDGRVDCFQHCFPRCSRAQQPGPKWALPLLASKRYVQGASDCACQGKAWGCLDALLPASRSQLPTPRTDLTAQTVFCRYGWRMHVWGPHTLDWGVHSLSRACACSQQVQVLKLRQELDDESVMNLHIPYTQLLQMIKARWAARLTIPIQFDRPPSRPASCCRLACRAHVQSFLTYRFTAARHTMTRRRRRSRWHCTVRAS